FRSQHDNQSWVAALTTILDVCSLVVARIEDKPVPTARLTFAMARHAVVDLCAVFRLKPTPLVVDRLPPSEEKRLEPFLAAAEGRLAARQKRRIVSRLHGCACAPAHRDPLRADVPHPGARGG